MPVLYSIYFSPWSLKARWALDHHGVEYEQREYMPIVGEPFMRLRLRKFTGKITVPILFGVGEPLTDSFAIARFAETAGTGPKLFPPGRGRELEAWNQRSETALSAGRLLSMAGVLEDPDAILESVPPPLNSLGSLGLKLGRSVTSKFLAKYRITVDAKKSAIADAHEVFQALRDQLNQSEGDYIYDAFSYADICMTVATYLCAPPDKRYFPLGEAGRRRCLHPELADEYSDLIAWRDKILERHYPPKL